ncbi:MAG: hypothetical protein N3F07_02095 [Candidatus Micrarchaeota archaeon]|nr:hypothetical protein [Candidatus Micrarchaeota archaeon]
MQDFQSKEGKNKASGMAYGEAKRIIDGAGFLQRPSCPDAVIREAIKAKNPREAAGNVRSALDKIARFSGERAKHAFGALENEDIARLFVSNPNAFADIANAVGENAETVFYALNTKAIKEMFEKNPKELAWALSQIAKAGGKDAFRFFYLLFDETYANMLKNNPEAMVETFFEIAKADQQGFDTLIIMGALRNERIQALFEKKRRKTVKALIDVAMKMGQDAWRAFDALANEAVPEKFFEDYLEGKKSFECLTLAIKSSDTYAIEVGRMLDDLHDNEPARRKYLASLSKEDVLALLLSNPEFFYTSTNHMLFDRLNKDFKPGELAEYLKNIGVEGTELHRNLIFRAINYDRLYGKKNSIFNGESLISILDSLLAPLNSGYDARYYYLLANALERFDEKSKRYIAKKIVREQARMISSSEEKDERKWVALNFLIRNMNQQEKNVFDASKYKDRDGKLLVVQIFDKDDTGKDHWFLSQKWFSKYAKPKKGSDGELIYETADARIVLFMGETEKDNQDFLRKILDRADGFILAFRGHSYSLKRNIPPEIFGNLKKDVLFIPGSCGSSAAIPEYMDTNPNTAFEFIANTSTGRGQVTNALLEILIRQAANGKKITVEEIIRSNSIAIQKNGGDPETLWIGTLGEKLIKHVNSAGYFPD